MRGQKTGELKTNCQNLAAVVQQMRGNCSPICVAITRLAPIPVRATSIRGCCAVTWPMRAASAAQRMSAQHCQRLIRRLRRDKENCLALVGHVDRIEPEQARRPIALRSAPAGFARQSPCPHRKTSQSHSASKPARRASDRAWHDTALPTAASTFAISPFSAAQSERIWLSNSSPSRTLMIAMP